MGNFYRDQISLMYNDVTVALQVVVIALLLLDYCLIFFKVEKYLKFSIPLLSIPEKFRYSSVEQIKNNKDLINCGIDPIVSYPRNIFSHIWSTLILIWPDGDNKIKGKVALSPLKLVFILIIFPSFYFIFESPWGEQFNNAFNSIFLFSFLSLGTVAGITMGVWFNLDMLKYKKDAPELEQASEEVEAFKTEVRRLKIRLVIGFILYLPLAAVILMPLIKIFPKAENTIGFGYFFCFVGWLGYHQVKLYFMRCLKCGNPFFRKGMWHNTFSSKCLHCGLSTKKTRKT